MRLSLSEGTFKAITRYNDKSNHDEVTQLALSYA